MMKPAVIFLITFWALTSAQNNSNQQCGAEQANIHQLEMENRQLRTNNQALAASGGMSAVNMLVGFLSGYAGSHSNSNNNKCCDDLDEIKETVRALQESNKALRERNEVLAEKVEVLQEQMSHVTSELTTTPSPATIASTASSTAITSTTGASTTTAVRTRCNDRDDVLFDGTCYFLTEETVETKEAGDSACNATEQGATLGAIINMEAQSALSDFFRERVANGWGEHFWTGGSYNDDTRTITWGNNDTTSADDVVWTNGYPGVDSVLYLTVYADTYAPGAIVGLNNRPPYAYRAICEY